MLSHALLFRNRSHAPPPSQTPRAAGWASSPPRLPTPPPNTALTDLNLQGNEMGAIARAARHSALRGLN